ncbi:MAG TPA: hypothetical protein PKM88_15645, partial [bacterium]|nr:hypothetical protein [bacterium]
MIEYDLDAESIPDDIVAQVGAETGLALPAGSRALRYHYVPPIDPIVFVKFAVPPDAQQALTAQLAALTWPLQS